MKLSIIIVNYNVQYFLEQTLLSIQKAASKIEHEVWVVDNHSVDGSVQMLHQKFPNVKLIANQENVGFSRANNQAISLSAGEFVLLLNPDTVLAEDTLERCLQKMEQDLKIGAIGVKMIDGGGNYLPESKRGFPSPATAFFKTTGLYRLFPNSGYFNKYYHGDLDPSVNHEIEILCGAFMFIRRQALDKAGMLDEAFFMYGEDIDLSYRIMEAGYKNYYLADTTIIHYKGESTKKGTLNYVKTFYQAMIIFANKHFHGQSASFYIAFIRMAIFFRGFLALVSGFIRNFKLPIADGLLLAGSLWLAKSFWAEYKFHNPAYFPNHFYWINVPLYTVIWVISIYLSRGYEKLDGYAKLWRGLFAGTFVIAAIYGFLNLEYRTSRAVILLALATGIIFLSLLRLLLVSLKLKRIAFQLPQYARILIAGNREESKRLINLIQTGSLQKIILGYVSPLQNDSDKNCLGMTSNLVEIARLNKINEIIFCSKDLETSEIMSWMKMLGPTVHYKILPPEGSFVIGSQSKETLGELYTFNIALNISQPSFTFQKRLTDILLAFVLLIMVPLLWVIYPKPRQLLNNLWNILAGKLSFVGYHPNSSSNLPPQKKGILNPLDEFGMGTNDERLIERSNFLYAKDIDISRYLQIIWKGRKKLNRPIS